MIHDTETEGGQQGVCKRNVRASRNQPGGPHRPYNTPLRLKEEPLDKRVAAAIILYSTPELAEKYLDLLFYVTNAVQYGTHTNTQAHVHGRSCFV